MDFSIVIPLYNKPNAIVATLQSVLAQTYQNFEIVVVDDGSTDDSARIVEEFIREAMESNRQSPMANRPSIRLVRKPNGGVSSARNRGIEEAKYDYIALLDGDDLWDEHYLEEQVKLICDFPEAKMWGINFAEMSEGKLIRTLPTGLPEGYRGYVENYFQIPGRLSDLYCSSSVVIKKEVFDKVGYFDERIKYAEDCDMWFRIIATYPVAFYDRYMVFYLYDAENRALNRHRMFKYYLPYYIDKYKTFKFNVIFYKWINLWAANIIRKYYFDTRIKDLNALCTAINRLDYSVLPIKYRILFKLPYKVSVLLNKVDILYHQKRK